MLGKHKLKKHSIAKTNVFVDIVTLVNCLEINSLSDATNLLCKCPNENYNKTSPQPRPLSILKNQRAGSISCL